MGKKQRERKERRLEQRRPGTAPPSWMPEEMSPAVREVMREMASYNPAKSEQEMMQALMDSAELRTEPELEEFEFDTSAVEKQLARLMPKYEDKLVRAKEQSEENWQAAYDDLRVEAIDGLLSRDWRQNFLRKYDAMMRRLGSGTDSAKFKQALMVRSVLDDKTFPWGGSALFGEMFEDAKEEARGRVAAADQVMQQMLQALGATVPEDLDKILQDPEKIKELEKSLNLTPEQQEQIDTMMSEALEDFERRLYAGELDLALYTNAEIDETTAQLNARTDAARAQGREMDVSELEMVGKLLQARVAEIVTPERLNEISEQATLTGDEWLNRGDEDGRLLHMEQAELFEVEPRENSFLYAALIGQLRRMEEPEGEFDADIGEHVIDVSSTVVDDTDSDKPVVETPATVVKEEEELDATQSRELRERLRGMFKRPL